MNILFFNWLQDRSKNKLWLGLGFLFVPMLNSALMFVYNSLKIQESKTNVVIVQPNIDPYNKFDEGNEVSTAKGMLYQAEQKMDSLTKWVIFPETSIVEHGDENRILSFSSYKLIHDFCKRHPGVNVLTGANTYQFYKPGEESATARKSRYGDFYDSYNAALHFNASGLENTYHKSKLVVGVEKMPYPELLGFLEVLSIDMGGISGSLGRSNEPVNFSSDTQTIAPLICYETVFPDYVRKFSRKGANALAIITNDGWWRNTAGHKQHLYYASLRAVENRRAIYRSANTGISAVILPNGSIKEETPWWVKTEVKYPYIANEEVTLFVRLGDYLGRSALYLTVLFLMGYLVKLWIPKKL
jgi:apolipoprotein N-acyltransferase